jgi:hypothetical protein
MEVSIVVALLSLILLAIFIAPLLYCAALWIDS